MIIPIDHTTLLRDLGAYAYGGAPEELAGKLQTLEGSAVDRLFTAAEVLYAFREQLDQTGLTLLGQLSGFIVNHQWQHPGEPDRMPNIYQGVLRDLEGMVFPDLVDPEPKTVYRTDGADWREKVAPNLDQLKAAKRAAVNQLRNEKQNGTIPTSFGAVDGDDTSKLKVNGMVTMALIAAQNQQPFEQSWTLADNSEVLLDGPSAIGMGVEVGQYIAACHANAIALKSQIDAVSVVDGDIDAALAELDTIDISTGWPT